MMTDLVGKQLGKYRLMSLLGRGGFAEVYRGEHIYLKSQAAIKVLRIVPRDEEVNNFLTEAQKLVSLRHPHIVRVLDFDVENGVPFLVMEYAPHGSLRQRYPIGTRLPLETIVSYVRQVSDALQYAHNEKLIHRDVKPENMLLGPHDEVLLSDFGIALVAPQTGSLTTQEMAGTVPYIAPEQIKGKPRPASDQYSLGMIVYEWLCGERPFQGPLWEIVNQHINTLPPPLHEKIPGISPAVEQVVLKALAKEPAQRFATVKEFASALEAALEQAYREVTIAPKAAVSTSQSPAPSQVETQPGSPPPIRGAETLTDRPIPQDSPVVQPEVVFATDQITEQPAAFAQTQLDPRSALAHTSTPPAQVAPSLHTGPDLRRPGLKEPALAPAVRDEVSLTGRARVPMWRRVAWPVGPVLLAALLVILGVLFYPTLINLTGSHSVSGTHPTTGTHPITTTPPPYSPMFGFNLQHTRFNPGQNFLTPNDVSGLTQEWKAATGSGIDSSPAIANGVVYVGSDDGRLHAFKVGTGTSLWGPNAERTGGQIRSSPAVDHGVVYVGSGDGKLYAFDATNGQLLWSAAIGTFIRSSPTVANGKIYIGSDDNNLYAFNAAGCGGSTTCRPLWTASTGGIIYYSSPAVVNGIVYIGSQDHNLYAFDANNGNLKWKALTGGPIDSSPAVVNGVVYVSSEDGTLNTFDAGSGTPKWHVSTGNALLACQGQGGSNRSSPAVANGVVYVGSDDGKLHAFSTSGKLLWTAATGGCVRSSPGVANGVVYAGSDDHMLYAFNAAGCGSTSCSPLWKYRTGGLVFSSPVEVNGEVYVGSGDKNLYAFCCPGETP
jgi:serine/threonine protein kinase/outer membrane protein assembly factor BamB